MDYKSTKLWKQLATNKELLQVIEDIRENCLQLADAIKQTIPGFTDHSVRHMDALWKIGDVIFTEEEIQRFSEAEIFVLGASFYFHDLGMSLAATKEGIEKIKSEAKFSSYYKRFVEFYKTSDTEAEIKAIQLTSRSLHADNAIFLCKEKVPGLNKFLIEKESIRLKWSDYIGEVAASHHWSLATIDNKIGNRGNIPAPNGQRLNLTLVSCALRIIDYAHINSDRANYIEKLLRLNIDDESLLHWKAQEKINGPIREDGRLKYVSYSTIEDIEAWWLFYDLVTGLDKEIVSVSEYLDSKVDTRDRFSLEGVFAVKNPKKFSALVRPQGFEPIDVRFKSDSLDRLVELLGGKTLYGNDELAPLRELLQNSRDAILLRQQKEEQTDNTDYQGKIIVSFDKSPKARLTVCDNGVGMTPYIIEKYLLGIASDYWNSEEFYEEFPDSKMKGFSPTGKFGIGFLSVYMIGETIEVSTERRGGVNIQLNLKGLGKHGALKTTGSLGNYGTCISIYISKQDPNIYDNLPVSVKRRAPMLSIPITVKINQTVIDVISPEWWKTCGQREFYNFTSSFGGSSYPPLASNYDDIGKFEKWPNKQPEVIGDNYRLIALPGASSVLLCSRGLAVEVITIRGLTGMVDVENLTVTAARNRSLEWDKHSFKNQMFKEISPIIAKCNDELKEEGAITARLNFLVKVANVYGTEVLLQSSVPWISLLVPPGEVKLYNTNDIIEQIKDNDDVFIWYGRNLWDAEMAYHENYPGASQQALIVPINSTSQPDVGNYSERGIFVGKLYTHFKKERHYLSTSDKEDPEHFKNATFLMIFLNLVATAWSVREELFYDAEWTRKTTDYICILLRKKDFL